MKLEQLDVDRPAVTIAGQRHHRKAVRAPRARQQRAAAVAAGMSVGEPPADLSADAQAVWKERVSVWWHMLTPSRPHGLTAGDRDVLRLRCEA